MKEFEVSARTIEEAISQGLEQLGVSISDVTVDVLEEGSKGLFGLFGSRPAKVKLTLKGDEASDEDMAHAILADAMKEEAPKEKKQAQPKQEKAAEKKQENKKPKAPKQEKAPKAEEAKAEAEAKPEQPKAEEKAEKPQKTRKPREKKEPKERPEPKEIVPAEQADRDTAAGKAQEFLQNLTKLMNVPVSVAVATDEEGNNGVAAKFLMVKE